MSQTRLIQKLKEEREKRLETNPRTKDKNRVFFVFGRRTIHSHTSAKQIFLRVKTMLLSLINAKLLARIKISAQTSYLTIYINKSDKTNK